MPAAAMPTQDWKTVTFNAGPARPAYAKDAAALKAARRTGDVLTERKANAAVTSAGVSVHKLDNTSEAAKHASVSADLRLAIMRARTAKSMTQKALATLCNVPAAVISEYESGKVSAPNNAFISKLERVLGAKLPRVSKG